ncbi:MAG: hypothetical protein H7839_15770 [Magnetococcus sp. YQC-5]
MTVLTTLIHEEDSQALRVHQEFVRRYGMDSGSLFKVELLIEGGLWSHYLGGRHKTHVKTKLRLTDGHNLRWASGAVIFNRVQNKQLAPLAKWTTQDGQSAAMDWHALLLSWLESVPCRVINPATPYGLSGVIYSDMRWALLARRAELPVRGFSVASDAGRLAGRCLGYRPEGVAGGVSLRGEEPVGGQEGMALGCGLVCLEDVSKEFVSVLVAGLNVVGDIPDGLKVKCVKLARIVNCELLQLWFAPGRRMVDWRFIMATPLPDFAGEGHLDAVVNYFGDQTRLRVSDR